MAIVIKVKDLEVGNIISYCGAKYRVLSIDPVNEFDMVIITTEKRVRGLLISNNFKLVRTTNEDIDVL